MTQKQGAASDSLALTDKLTVPDETILGNVLGQTKPLLDTLLCRAAQVNLAWNYYNDGKAWLGKLMYKRKNLGWLHVYPGYFKVTVYFTDNTAADVTALHLPERIIGDFPDIKHSGKLIPLSITPESQEDIGSILSLLELKMSHR